MGAKRQGDHDPLERGLRAEPGPDDGRRPRARVRRADGRRDRRRGLRARAARLHQFALLPAGQVLHRTAPVCGVRDDRRQAADGRLWGPPRGLGRGRERSPDPGSVHLSEAETEPRDRLLRRRRAHRSRRRSARERRPRPDQHLARAVDGRGLPSRRRLHRPQARRSAGARAGRTRAALRLCPPDGGSCDGRSRIDLQRGRQRAARSDLRALRRGQRGVRAALLGRAVARGLRGRVRARPGPQRVRPEAREPGGAQGRPDGHPPRGTEGGRDAGARSPSPPRRPRPRVPAAPLPSRAPVGGAFLLQSRGR